MVGLLGCNDPEVVEEGSCAGQQVVCLACLNLRVWDEISIPYPSLLVDSAKKRGEWNRKTQFRSWGESTRLTLKASRVVYPAVLVKFVHLQLDSDAGRTYSYIHLVFLHLHLRKFTFDDFESL